MRLRLPPATCLLCAVFLGPVGWAAQLDRPEDVLARAKELHLSGSLEEAAELYREVIPTFRERQDRENLASALNALSVANASLGRHVEALEQAAEAAELRRAIGDRAGEAMSLGNLGLAHYYLGEFEAALDRHRQALELNRRNQDAEGQVADLNSIANVFFLQGNYTAAWDSYELALKLVEENPEQAWSASERYRTLVNLAALFQKLGLYDRSLNVYSQLENSEENLPVEEQAQLLVNQGVLYRRLGDPVKARENYLRAASLFDKLAHAEGRILVQKNLGIVQALDFADLAAAVKSFENAERLAAENSNRRELMQARLYLAEALRRLGQIERAETLFSNALLLARQMLAAEETWKALFGLGQIERGRGRNEQARAFWEQAVDELESLRSRLQLPSLRPGFLGDKREVFDHLIALHLQDFQDSRKDPDLDRLATLMEQARRQPFRDQFGAGRSSRGPFSRLSYSAGGEAPEDVRLLRQLAELKGEMTRVWQQQLAGRSDSALQGRLAEMETKYLRVERELSGRSPVPVREYPAIAEIQARLPEKAVLISFWVGQGWLGAVLVHGAGAELFSQPLSPELESQAVSCAAAVAGASDSWRTDCRSAADTVLGARLLQRLKSGFEHWIIVPDRVLNYLPFEVLESPGSGGPWIEETTISYLPDSALLGRREPTESPAFPWEPVFAGFGNPEVQEGAFLDDPPERIGDSAREVEMAADALPGRNRVVTGQALTRQAVTQSVRDGFRILHLASHATLDARQPDRSRVLLSPAHEGAPADYLFLGEILDFPLGKVDLVVLSACETAGSAADRAGGVENFGRAFLYAGARSTLTTLWKVDDQATAAFMQLFYRFSAKGQSRTQALRSAKLSFLQSGTELAHPHYWAPFVLYGEAETSLPLPWRWSSLITILLLLLAGGSGVLAWRRARRAESSGGADR